MNAADAIYAGFADYFIPEDAWPNLIKELETNGDYSLIDGAAIAPGTAPLAGVQSTIDALFAGETLGDCLRMIEADDSAFAQQAAKAIARNCPLSTCVTIEMMHRLRGTDDMPKALDLEYRFTFRASEHGDLLEGIRAAIIDKDRTPKWTHQSPHDVSLADVSKMLRPLGPHSLKLEK